MTDVQKLALVELSKFGDIAWARFGKYDPGGRLVFPPVIVWRYKVQDRSIEDSLVNAAQSFTGNYKWKIEVGGPKRNLVLAPAQILELEKQGVSGPQNYLAESDPAFSNGTLLELPLVIEHIINRLTVN